MSAHRRLKEQYPRNIRIALAVAIALVLFLLGFGPSPPNARPEPDADDGLQVIELPPELVPPPPPAEIARPKIPIEAIDEDVVEEEDFRDTTFDPNDAAIAPPPPPAAGTFQVFDRAPRPRKIVKPVYPEIALAAEIEGTVICFVTVGPRGNVLRVVIHTSDSEVFDESIVAALRQWIWEPAEQSGVPVQATVLVPYRFSLNR